MRFMFRLGIALVALMVIAVAGFAGQYVGRTRAPAVPVGDALPPPARATTDEQIMGLLGRIQRRPDDANAYARLGEAYLQKARESGDPSFYPRAEAALTKALALDAEDADVYVGLGTLALARHQFEDALVLGHRARALNPYKAAALGVIGDAQVELGRYEEAQQTVQAMLNLRPDLAAFARASYLRELHGDVPAAIDLMRRAVAGDPGSEAHAWTQVQLGHLYFNSGDLVAAEREYERTLFQRPDYLHAKAGIARVQAARGDYAGAAAIYEAITQAIPFPEYLIALADVHRAAGNTAAAIEAEALVLTLDRLSRENGVNTDVELALFRADRGVEINAAVDFARQAHAVRRGIHAADALAWTLYRAGHCEEAQVFAEQALRLGTKDALMHFHAGMIADARGQTDEARRHFEQALAINPHFSLLYAPQVRDRLKALGQGPVQQSQRRGTHDEADTTRCASA